MPQSESTVGARVIVPPTKEDNNRDLPARLPSPDMPSPTNTKPPLLDDHSQEFDPTVGAKPFSPFYRHATTKASMEQLKCDVRIAGRGYTSQDLESGARSPYKQSMDINGRASKLWVQNKRRCGWMQAMSRKQRIAVKVLIAVFIIGAMVGIALGITAAVGGGVWRSDNRQSSIGEHR